MPFFLNHSPAQAEVEPKNDASGKFWSTMRHVGRAQFTRWMLNQLVFVILVVLYWYRCCGDFCGYSCNFIDNQDATCLFYRNTASCENRWASFAPASNDSSSIQLRTCDVEEDDVHVELRAYVVEQNIYAPFVKLNVSLHLATGCHGAAVSRFRCLQVIGVQNAFCNRTTHLWTCRMLEWNMSQVSGFLSAGLDCFPLPDMSVIEVNVSVYTQACMLRYLVYSPDAFRLESDTGDWLPFILIDLNHLDRLLVRTSSPKMTVHGRIDLWQRVDSVYVLKNSQQVVNWSNAVSFVGLNAGEYTVELHVLHDNCESLGRCPSQAVPFFLDRDYDDGQQLSWKKARFLSVAFLCCTLSLLMISLAWSQYAIVKRDRRLRRRAQLQQGEAVVPLPVSSRPKVLVIYSHDDEAHCRCVILLARLLNEALNCEVMVDEWALQDSAISAVDWMVDCLQRADTFLLVFSKGMLQSTSSGCGVRPWAEVAPLGFTAVVQRAVSDRETNRALYLCARFSYTLASLVPPFLCSQPWIQCCLIDQLDLLAVHLHRQDYPCSSLLQLSNCPLVGELRSAIELCSTTSNTSGFTSINAATETGGEQLITSSKRVSFSALSLADHVDNLTILDPMEAFNKHAHNCHVYQLLPPDASSRSIMPNQRPLLPPDPGDFDNLQIWKMSDNTASSLQVFKLKEDEELRFEASKGVVTLELVDGIAEIFGSELMRNKPYQCDSGLRVGVYTWHGCTLHVTGPAEGLYVATHTPMVVYLNTHAAIDYMRQNADRKNIRGPRIMVVGPTDVGKSTYCRILLNYAVRMGRTPTFVDLDVGQGQISVPGTLSALYIEKSADPIEGFDKRMPIVYSYGHLTPGANISLYNALVEQLAKLLNQRCAENRSANTSGFVINTSGWVKGAGYTCLVKAVDALDVDVVVVLDHERLYNEMRRDLAASVKVIHQPKSGGVEERSREMRIASRRARIHEYFYGSTQQPYYPHTFEVSFADVLIFKIGAPMLPDSCMPLGMKAEDTSLKIVPVTPSNELLNHILAVSFCETAQDDILNTNVAGFIWVSEVSMERKVLTVLSPQPTPLPSKILLYTEITFMDMH
ncbi:Protein CLP1 -like protein, partial [Trichinella pseudospiralis]